jgi:hypothetical protein
MFSTSSRYYGIATAELPGTEGPKIVYVRRRFLPALTGSRIWVEHDVTESERLDHITAQYLGDPEQFWRIADANTVMRPEELIKVGHHLRIPLPEGA